MLATGRGMTHERSVDRIGRARQGRGGARSGEPPGDRPMERPRERQGTLVRGRPVSTPRPGAVTPDLTIGVVGPHDLVERVMLMGHGPSPVPSRLVAAAYRDEQEAADKVVRLGSGGDVCLFASPVPYEFARKAGVLTMPATYVPLNGAALQGTLLRAALNEHHEPSRVSIDVLSRAEVEEAYGEINLSTEHVHLREEAAG